MPKLYSAPVEDSIGRKILHDLMEIIPGESKGAVFKKGQIIGAVQVIGVPACALFFKTMSIDLFLPRLLAGVSNTRMDMARMGHGAFCLDCKTCSYPKCPFGK